MPTPAVAIGGGPQSGGAPALKCKWERLGNASAPRWVVARMYRCRTGRDTFARGEEGTFRDPRTFTPRAAPEAIPHAEPSSSSRDARRRRTAPSCPPATGSESRRRLPIPRRSGSGHGRTTSPSPVSTSVQPWTGSKPACGSFVGSGVNASASSTIRAPSSPSTTSSRRRFVWQLMESPTRGRRTSTETAARQPSISRS
jgi:hypothetical protein